MKKNMGSLDRMLRLLLAAVIATLYFTEIITGTAAVIGLVLALVFSFTSVMGSCPLYLPFGINTNPKKD